MKKIALFSALLASASCVQAQETVGGKLAVGVHGFYYAFGVLLCNSGERVDYTNTTGRKEIEANSYGTRLGGTLALGYQYMHANQPLCIGFEIGSDFSPRHEDVNNHKTILTPAAANDSHYNLTTTRNGFRPFAGIRLGYVNYNHKFMSYLKLGMSYANSKEKYFQGHIDAANNLITDYNSSFKCACWTPTITLGIEKSFTQAFTIRGEAEYKFRRTKDRYWTGGDHMKFEQKASFNIRTLFCHNIKLGSNQ